jgi:protein O-GlcNAc transferase
MPPGAPADLLNQALACHHAGRLDQAQTLYQQVLQAVPEHAEALGLLGTLLHQRGKHAAAEQYLQQSVRLDASSFMAHYNLGLVLIARRKWAQAVGALESAARLDPRSASASYNLGHALVGLGKLEEAARAFPTATALHPGHAAAWNHLGQVLAALGQADAALLAFERASAIQPPLPEALCNLGMHLVTLRRPQQAQAALERCLALRPEMPQALGHLGSALFLQGRLDEALACHQRALALSPNDAQIHSNLVYALHFHPRTTGPDLQRELAAWRQRHAASLPACPHQVTDRDPDRRLRLGLISPDMHEHPVGRGVLPVLEHLDRTRWEVTCFHNHRRGDWLTQRTRVAVDHWLDVADLRDDQLAAAVAERRIDILLDLSLHMGDNRLLVFARRPAPVQVTWAGYPGSTGLTTVDYRLTDPWLDPPGSGDQDYSEVSIRLPHSFWCFDPLSGGPEVNDLPARRAGKLTFGSLNNFAKVNHLVLELWARVLLAVPRSEMLILGPEGDHRARTVARLGQLGVDPACVRFADQRPRQPYLALHHEIDVILDTFPYNGHSTTLDALWMGVPVVSLAGPTAVARGGLSILSNVGLPELAARTPDDYVRIAAALAGDVPRLAALRAGLRGRMQASPLMDLAGFTRDWEAALRGMWRRWCAGAGPAAPRTR